MPTNLHTSYIEEITNPQAYTKLKKKSIIPLEVQVHTYK